MKCVYFCHILVEVFSHMFFEPSYIQTLKRWMHKAHRKQNLRFDVVCKRGTADKKWKLIETYTNTKGNTTHKPKAEFLKLQQA